MCFWCCFLTIPILIAFKMFIDVLYSLNITCIFVILLYLLVHSIGPSYTLICMPSIIKLVLICFLQNVNVSWYEYCIFLINLCMFLSPNLTMSWGLLSLLPDLTCSRKLNRGNSPSGNFALTHGVNLLWLQFLFCLVSFGKQSYSMCVAYFVWKITHTLMVSHANYTSIVIVLLGPKLCLKMAATVNSVTEWSKKRLISS